MKRNEIKNQILKLGWQQLTQHGVTSLRMRDLAKGCKCSVGTVYNVFNGMEEIILRLNVRSLEVLFDMILKALDGVPHLNDGVKAMGNAYMAFATEYPKQWKTLFERESLEKSPQWYSDELNRKLQLIQERLISQYQLQREDAIKLVGFFWAAIHGITSILLHKKTRVVEHIIKEEDLDRYIDHCLIGMIP